MLSLLHLFSIYLCFGCKHMDWIMITTLFPTSSAASLFCSISKDVRNLWPCGWRQGHHTHLNTHFSPQGQNKDQLNCLCTLHCLSGLCPWSQSNWSLQLVKQQWAWVRSLPQSKDTHAHTNTEKVLSDHISRHWGVGSCACLYLHLIGHQDCWTICQPATCSTT